MDRAGVRRVVSGLLRAQSLDALVAGAGDDSAALQQLLLDVARGRGGRWYGTVARAARRQSLAAASVADRAAVFLAALEARRRDDLYRVLGVPPLASEAALRDRWLELSRTTHVRAGEDPGRYRVAREAWETLRDPIRRADYERWWLRALGPFEAPLQQPAQGRSSNGGGASGPGAPDATSASSAGCVSASSASRSSSGSAPGGAAASRARPSRRSVRAPR
jgi:hypothetical protein